MSSIPQLLDAWRAAERRWERVAPPDAVRAAALDVVTAWAAYQGTALPADSHEFMLVADDEQYLVACTPGVVNVLGYEPSELVGRQIADIAAPDTATETAADWAAFESAGRLDGRFRLRTKDGRLVDLDYQARAHHPVPGFHVSRLWPDTR